MSFLEVRLPDGSRMPVDQERLLGRGSPAVLVEPSLSRQQFRLTPMQPGALLLENVGVNAVIVEVQAAAAAGGGSSNWQLSDLLDRGQTTVVGPRSRFFVADRQEGTTLEVVEPPGGVGGSAAGAGAGGGSGSGGSAQPPQQQQLLQQELEEASRAAAVALQQQLWEDDAGAEPQPKRARTKGTVCASTAAAEAAAQAVPPSSSVNAVPSLQDAPFSLLAVRGLAPALNTGCLGARLSQLVCGRIKLAFVENFMIDMPWLLSACPDLAAAESLVVVHGEQGDDRERQIEAVLRAAGLSGRTLLHRPPLPIAYGTHHSKAFILQYDTGVRVIIHTANMLHGDCNHKTQGLFVQDFPRLKQQQQKQQQQRRRQAPPNGGGGGGCGQHTAHPSSTPSSSSSSSSSFGADLADYLAQLKLGTARDAAAGAAAARALQELVDTHDFSSARGHLVASVPGYHRSGRLTSYGHMRVRSLLASEPLDPGVSAAGPPQLVCQYSSLGSIDERWLLDEFGGSLRAAAAPPGGAARQAPLAQQQQQQARGRMSLVWPTVQEVRNSLEGWDAGRCIPGPDRNVSRPFLAPLFCRFDGSPVGRQRAMPHIKTFCRHAGRRIAWFVVTSHNLSKAAWGVLQNVKGGGGQQQLMVRSYELGVLLTPASEARYRASPHFRFSCTDAQQQQGQPAVASAGSETRPSAAEGPAEVEFWALEELLSAYSDSGGGAEGQAAAAEAPAVAGGASTSSGAASGSAADAAVLVRRRRIRVYLPLPYQLPPLKYRCDAAAAADVPWRVDVACPGLDSFGFTMGGNPNSSLYGHLQEPEEV